MPSCPNSQAAKKGERREAPPLSFQYSSAILPVTV